MNNQVHELIDQVNKLHDKHDQFVHDNKVDDSKLDMIIRGIYGDKENKALGLIERQELDDFRFNKLQKEVEANTTFRERLKRSLKIAAVGGGAGGSGIVATYLDKIMSILHIN